VCFSAENLAELPASVFFGVFDKGTGNNVSGSPFRVVRTSKEQKELGQVDPCIVNPPAICFQIGIYITTITIPINSLGYTVSFQSCCRDNSMANIVDTHNPNDQNNFPGNGATYFTELPGSTGIITNSSPVFAKDEAVLVCAGKKFTYDFSATDINNDSIVYKFCEAYGGGKVTSSEDKEATPPAAIAPPYSSIPYKSPYNGGAPLGIPAFIDPVTGVISGIAPAAGKYVVTVCAYEYQRGTGKLLGIHRKDFHMNVTTCVKEVVAAMPEKYNDCSGYTVTFLNNSTEGKTYDWNFGDGAKLTTTSTDPIQHTYAVDGTYTVKLYVDSASNCGDSATAIAYIYPLLKPAVSISGFCSNTTTTFNNTSSTSSGSDLLNYYRWDFGVSGTENDTSLVKSPQYKYPGPGNYTVVLLLRTANGCEQHDTSNIVVYDSPPLYTTGDTLLCIRNSLQLFAESNVDGNVVPGTYTWSPNYNITGANTATPVVTPKRDTAYTVMFTDGTGCVNTKRVAVDVRDTLIVRTGADSLICTGDQVTLYAAADGKYPLTWYNLDNNAIIGNGANLTITPDPPVSTYFVRGELGDCSGGDTMQLRLVDPPVPYAGPDSTICYGEQIVLQASGGTFYQWTPTFTLSTPQLASTIAKPLDTTYYIVSVTDNKGCPKVVRDTVKISVVPQVPAFAGNDTIAILNQPFPLHATGGATYVWSPVDGLSNPNIDTPFTIINRDITYTVTAYTIEGCSGKDDIYVRFIAGPEIYIPTGFTPNGDGTNDIFRPLPVGIVELEFFRVYDRWGKLMFSTNQYMKGWDGTYKGQPAAVNTYVWLVQGKNVKNETVLRKGTVTLLR
jgi:gliding motility-associated-like protein